MTDKTPTYSCIATLHLIANTPDGQWDDKDYLSALQLIMPEESVVLQMLITFSEMEGALVDHQKVSAGMGQWHRALVCLWNDDTLGDLDVSVERLFDALLPRNPIFWNQAFEQLVVDQLRWGATDSSDYPHSNFLRVLGAAL